MAQETAKNSSKSRKSFSDEAQQHPRRQLHRRLGQKAQPRQKHRRRVSAPGQGRQCVAPPPQGKPRQPGRAEEEQIVHQSVQNKHAVYVNDRHAAPPPFSKGYYRTGKPGKRSQSVGKFRAKKGGGAGGGYF